MWNVGNTISSESWTIFKFWQLLVFFGPNAPKIALSGSIYVHIIFVWNIFRDKSSSLREAVFYTGIQAFGEFHYFKCITRTPPVSFIACCLFLAIASLWCSIGFIAWPGICLSFVEQHTTKHIIIDYITCLSVCFLSIQNTLFVSCILTKLVTLHHLHWLKGLPLVSFLAI